MKLLLVCLLASLTLNAEVTFEHLCSNSEWQTWSAKPYRGPEPPSLIRYTDRATGVSKTVYAFVQLDTAYPLPNEALLTLLVLNPTTFFNCVWAGTDVGVKWLRTWYEEQSVLVSNVGGFPVYKITYERHSDRPIVHSVITTPDIASMVPAPRQ
jgi:hypothetical protein